MFQDAARNFDIEFDERGADKNDKILSFCQRKILCRVSEANDVDYPCLADFHDVDASSLIYLFAVDGKRIFLSTDECARVEGFEYQNINVLREVSENALKFAGITGFHYFYFHKENKFCSKCGESLCHAPKKRCMLCESCGNKVFPKISPAVIVGIIDEKNDSILMTRYAQGEYKKLALVAGFIEMGESAECGAKREAMEEAGLEISSTCYYKSQPWGYAQNLLLGYFARIKGSNEIHMDKEELCEAMWIKRDDVQAEENSISLTGEMMWAFKNGKIPDRWEDIL